VRTLAFSDGTMQALAGSPRDGRGQAQAQAQRGADRASRDVSQRAPGQDPPLQ